MHESRAVCRRNLRDLASTSRLQGNYGLMLARFVHQEGASVGGLTLPSAGVSLEWDAIKGLGFALNAHGDAALLDSSYPSSRLEERQHYGWVREAMRKGSPCSWGGLALVLLGNWRRSRERRMPSSSSQFLGRNRRAVRTLEPDHSPQRRGLSSEFDLQSSALYRLPELPSGISNLDWASQWKACSPKLVSAWTTSPTGHSCSAACALF